MFIVITDYECFIFLKNITTVDKDMKFVRQLMIRANNLNNNYNIYMHTLN